MLPAQYYIRGDVRDEKSNPLQNVRIILHSTGLPYTTGIGGAFGILSSKETDSLTFSLEGYESFTGKVKTTQYVSVELKMLPFTASLQKHHLLSRTRDLQLFDEKKWVYGDETYSTLVENDFIRCEKYPQTAMVLNVDRASYSNVRRFINMNSIIPPNGVRIEEMLNYFNFNYIPPSGDSNFAVHSNLSTCPWTEANQLLFLQVDSRKINLESVAPSNLVFLIDVSGSMDLPNRLPLLKVAFRKLVENLRPKDTVSIVVYGGVVGVMLQPTSGDNKKKILEVIEDLSAGGFTPGEAGIRQAYRLAQSQFIKGGNNRVILATDGDFNVGQTTEKELEELIIRQKQTGIYLTCLGVGMGNYKDSKIEVLAKKGNGNFAYIDDEREAEKVLVKEFTQTLYSIADDVYMDVSFNPEIVKEYRLIGFDNKTDALADSSSMLEGGEVGSGHSIIAIFEIVPTFKNANMPKDGIVNEQIANVTLNYCLPGKKQKRTTDYKCSFKLTDFKDSDPHIRFAASVALFGSMLRFSPHVNDTDWDELILMTQSAIDEKDPLQAEFYDLVQKAKRIYSPVKKKKKKDDQ